MKFSNFSLTTFISHLILTISFDFLAVWYTLYIDEHEALSKDHFDLTLIYLVNADGNEQEEHHKQIINKTLHNVIYPLKFRIHFLLIQLTTQSTEHTR